MKTQDIRNMGLALQSVQEKILTQKDKEKALAKAARSAKPKSQVSLKPMPASLANKMAKDEAFKKGDAVTPSKGPHAGQQHKVIHDYGDGHYNIKPHGVTGSQNKYRQGAAKAHKSDLKKMTTGVVKLPHEALKGDQHKLDHDNDGDIDAADFKKLRNKKKGEKSEVKARQEPTTENGKGDAPMEKKESTRWPVYARIMEKATHKGGATPPEEMDSKDSPSAKKMKADHKPEVKDNPEASGDDVKKASDSAPATKARGNDNMKGDKAIVNPVKGAVTK